MCAHGKLCCLSCIAAASPCRLLLVPFCCPRQPLLHCSGSAVSSPSTMSSQNPPLRRSFPAESFPPALLSPHQPPSPAYFGGTIKQIPPSPSPAPCIAVSLWCRPFHLVLHHLKNLPVAQSLHFPSSISALSVLQFTEGLLYPYDERPPFSSLI